MIIDGDESITWTLLLEKFREMALQKIDSLLDMPDKNVLTEADLGCFYSLLSEKRSLVIHIDEFQRIFEFDDSHEDASDEKKESNQRQC